MRFKSGEYVGYFIVPGSSLVLTVYDETCFCFCGGGGYHRETQCIDLISRYNQDCVSCMDTADHPMSPPADNAAKLNHVVSSTQELVWLIMFSVLPS